MRKWLWIDAPGSVPVELIDMFYERDSGALSMLRVLRMFRLFRLLRLFKIDEYIETLENAFDINLRFMRIVFMLLRICFLAHILGCFWCGLPPPEPRAVRSLAAQHLRTRISAPNLLLISGRSRSRRFGVHLLEAGDPDTVTWARTYDDGAAAAADTELAMRYLYSVYWAVTTLTTVGYGDITPQNDGERGYALGAMLCSALVFGYMMSSIGALVASMDRQAALVEEKNDQVKEYVAWRALPRGLANRVKKHYSFYYTRRPAFDELALLEGLSPSLRAAVTKYVLNETLGRLPIFTGSLDPEFQMQVFPLIKPVSYLKGEVVFRRGEPSRDLFFLLSGEVSVYSSINAAVCTRITPDEEITLSQWDPNEEVMRTVHTGCFGESVLTGRRRPATHVASAWSEMLLLTKSGLLTLFERSPKVARRIIMLLSTEMERKERLAVLLLRFMIGAAKPNSTARAAMIIQKVWKRYANAIAASDGSVISRVKEYDEFCAPSESSQNADSAKANGKGGTKGGAKLGPAAAHKAATQEIIEQAEKKVAALLAELKAGLEKSSSVGEESISLPSSMAPSPTKSLSNVSSPEPSPTPSRLGQPSPTRLGPP